MERLCVFPTVQLPRGLFTEMTSGQRHYPHCNLSAVSVTRGKQPLVLSWALYNAALFPEELSANTSSPTNKESREGTCHHSEPLPLKCCHHSCAADHWSANQSFQKLVQSHILLVSICHCSISLCPFCAHQDLYFKKSTKKPVFSNNSTDKE